MSNVYDLTSEDFFAAEARRAQQALVDAVDVNPDEAARAMVVADVAQVPAPVVLGDLKHFETQTKVAASSDLLRNSLELRAYVNSNPLAAKVSNDDLANLDNAAQVVKGVTPGGVAARAALASAVPAVGSLPAIGFGAQVGATLGAFGGPAAPVTVPLGAILGGAAAGLGAGYALAQLQDWLLAQLPRSWVESIGQTPEQRQMDLAQHPNWAYAGGLVPFALTMKPWGATQTARLVSGGANVGLEAGQQLVTRGELDYNQLAMSAAFGYVFANPNRVGASLIRPGEDAAIAAMAKFKATAGPYIFAGKQPPIGVDPVVDGVRVAQAPEDVAALYEALQASLASTTRERAPSLYADFVRQITDGEVGIPVDAIHELYAGKFPEPGDGLLGWVPDLIGQAERAAITGADVRVPIADWLAHVTPETAKLLEPSLRVRDGGLTVKEATELPVGFDVYHGSPHSFDVFDLSKIGTGEGAQTYGHGLYFAQNPAVGRSYQNSFDATINGRPFNINDPVHRATAMAQELGSRKAALDEAVATRDKAPNYTDDFWAQVVKTLEGDKPLPKLESIGNLYRARILRREEEFLDWDRPLAEQPPEVIEKLARLTGTTSEALKASPLKLGDWLDAMGGGPHGAVWSKSEEMSKALVAVGIPGIKYLDQGSRTLEVLKADIEALKRNILELESDRPDSLNIPRYKDLLVDKERQLANPTRNFVLFSDKDVQILERNGEAVDTVRKAAGLTPKPPIPPTGDQAPTQPFETGSVVGMNQAEYVLYLRRMNEQQAADQAYAAKKALEDARKRQTAVWKEQEAEVRKDVIEDLKTEPQFAAVRFFRDGLLIDEKVEPKPRLDVSMLPPEVAAKVPSAITSKRGMNPDDAAEVLGFRTGRELVDALIAMEEARTRLGLRPIEFSRHMIDAETARRMEEIHGDLNAKIIEDAKDHVFSEATIDRLHEETLALAADAGEQFPIKKVPYLNELKDRFGELSLKSADSDKFIAEAGRAARAEALALLKNDRISAFQQRQRQYNATVFAREALAIEQAKVEFEDLAKKYAARNIASVDRDSTTFIQELLQQAGVPLRVTPAEVAEYKGLGSYRSFGEYVEAQFDAGYSPQVSLELVRDGAKRLDTMTTGEFLEFKDAIESLDFIGRNINKINVGGTKRDFGEWRTEVIENIRQLPKRDSTEVERGGRLLWQIDAPWTRMEEIVKDLDLRKEFGPLWDALIRPADLSKTKALDLLKDVTAQMEKINGYGRQWRKSLDEKIEQDFIVDTYNGGLMEMTRWNMIRMMMNWGNRSNVNVLVDGITRAKLGVDEKPAINELQATRAKIEELFDRYATKQDWDYAQHMLDIFSGFRDQIATLQYNTGGTRPKWIEPVEIETKFGTYRGGYFPLIPDKLRKLNPDLAERDAPDYSSGIFGRDFFRATTNQSHLIDRTGARYFVDITNGPEQLVGRLQQVIQDLAYRDWAITAGKIVYDGALKQAITKHYGPEYTAQLEPWVKRTVGYFDADEAALGGFNRILRFFRLNTLAYALPLNYAVEFSPTVALANLKKMVEFNAQRSLNVELVNEHSQEIRHTMYAVDRDVKEMTSKVLGGRTLGGMQARAVEGMLKPLVWMEQQSRMVTFWTEFTKQKAAGKSDADAAALGDSRIRERHGVAQMVDLPALLANKNEFMKAATLFMGFHTMNRNWMRQMPGQLRREEYGDFAKTMWGTLGVATLFNLALFTRPKEGEEWWKFMARAALSVPMAMVPVGRDIWSFYSEGYRATSPGASAGIAVYDLAKDAYNIIAEDKSPKRPIRHAATVAGLFGGVPGTLQIGRTTQFLSDYYSGKQRPKDFTTWPGFVEWMRGITTGDIKLQKR